MSTAARKARKRAGIKFERTPKVGTPVAERADNIVRRDRKLERAVAATRVGLFDALRSRLGWDR